MRHGGWDRRDNHETVDVPIDRHHHEREHPRNAVPGSVGRHRRALVDADCRLNQAGVEADARQETGHRPNRLDRSLAPELVTMSELPQTVLTPTPFAGASDESCILSAVAQVIVPSRTSAALRIPEAVDFADHVCTSTERFPRGYEFLVDQLNRAALSNSANIAEGNGSFTKNRSSMQATTRPQVFSLSRALRASAERDAAKSPPIGDDALAPKMETDAQPKHFWRRFPLLSDRGPPAL